MSEPGRPTAAGERPSEEVVRPLIPHVLYDGGAPSGHDSGDEETNGAQTTHDHAHASPRRFRLPFTHLSPAAVSKWKRETKYGVAALLSFVIFVSALLMQKGKELPTLAMENSGKSSKGDPEKKKDGEGKPRGEDSSPAAPEPPPSTPGSGPSPDPTPPAPSASPKDAQVRSAAEVKGAETAPAANPPGEVPPVTAPPGDPPSALPVPPQPLDQPATSSLPDPGMPPETPVPLPQPVETPKEAQPPKDSTGPAPASNPQLPGPAADSPNPPLPTTPQAEPPTASSPAPASDAAPQAPAASNVSNPATPPAAQGPAAEAPMPTKTEELPNLSTPPASPDPVAPVVAAGAAGAAGLIPIPNIRKPRASDEEMAPRETPIVTAAVPAESRDAVVEEQVEPVPHVVESGENFWTISRVYYGSGRYYKALWKANSKLVSAPEKLAVGMTIRIPPPEALDRTLIQPPQVGGQADQGQGSPLRRASSPRSGSSRSDGTVRRSSEIDLALPVAEPVRNRDARASDELTSPAEESETVRPIRVLHRVRRNETLRTIARETLGNSRRYREILDLNRTTIADPNNLVPGQLIELPDDARPSRRAQ